MIAAKISSVPIATTQYEPEAQVGNTPVGTSHRCNIWVRGAVHLLISKRLRFHAIVPQAGLGWIQCNDAEKLAALPNRGDIAKRTLKCEVIIITKSKYCGVGH